MYSDRYTPPLYGRRHSGREQVFHGKNGRIAQPFQRGGKAVLPAQGTNNRYQPYKPHSLHQTQVRNGNNHRISKQRKNHHHANNTAQNNRYQRWPAAVKTGYDINNFGRTYLTYSPAADGYGFAPKRSGSNWLHSQAKRLGRNRRQQLQRDRLRRESSPAMRRQRSQSYQPSIASITSPLSRVFTPQPNAVTTLVPKTDGTTPGSSDIAPIPEPQHIAPTNVHAYYDHLPAMSPSEVQSMMDDLGLSLSSALDLHDDGVDEPYIPLPDPSEEDDLALDDDIDDAFLELGIDLDDSDYSPQSSVGDGSDIGDWQPANLRDLLDGMSSMDVVVGATTSSSSSSYGIECS